jgi:hypothetical protein
MRATTFAVLLLVLFLPAAFGSARHLDFERTLPAPVDLGNASDLVVAQAIGDTSKVDEFVQTFVDQVNRSRTLRAVDATHHGSSPVPKADVQLAVRSFTCTSTERKGEAGAYDENGKRVRRAVVWSDAICSARLEVLKPGGLPKSFTVRGEGTSPRSEQVTEEERDIALLQATHFAAVDASNRITPRRVRESIELDAEAPAFSDGMAMIDADRMDAARKIWERELKRDPRSAALHFNLGAVCEALADVVAAEQHYRAAHEIAPKDARYASALRLLERRK